MFIDETRDRAGGKSVGAKNRYEFELDFGDFWRPTRYRSEVGRRSDILIGVPAIWS